MINKKFLDVLYFHRADYQSSLDGLISIKDFKEGDCSIPVHNSEIKALQSNISDTDILISEYIKIEGK